MRNMKSKLLLFLAIITFPSAIYAGGYRVSLQGVRQAALGAQGATLSHDASVAFFNPAALSFVEGKFSVAIGGFGVGVNSKYQNRITRETAESNNPLGTPVYAAASYKPTENLAVGVSFTTPFGSTVDWGNEWSGRYAINKIALKSYFIQPTVSYKFNDWFGVGFGYIIAQGSVNIQKSVAAGNNDVTLEVESTEGKGTGFNVGVFIKPHERVNLGIAYRSKVQMEVENGSAKWTNVPSMLSSSIPFTTDKFSAELPLPYEAIFGVSVQATPKLLLMGEVGSVGWEEYRSLVLNFTGANDTKFKSEAKKDFTHTYNYSLGAEYAATNSLAVRLGYKFDSNPSPGDYFSPETPTVDYHAFTAGLGYRLGGFNIDAMAEYLKGNERSFLNVENNFGGDILSSGFIFGLGLSYNLN